MSIPPLLILHRRQIELSCSHVSRTAAAAAILQTSIGQPFPWAREREGKANSMHSH